MAEKFTVDIGANVSEFIDGFKKSVDVTKEFSQEIGKSASSATRSIDEINDAILKQKTETIDLERELINLQNVLKSTPASYDPRAVVEFAESQKIAKRQLVEVQTELKKSKVALRALGVEKAGAVAVEKKQKEALKGTKLELAASQIIFEQFGFSIAKAKKNSKELVAGLRAVIKSLGAVKAAVVATGIGALLVIVGLVAANFDKIKGAVNGVSAELVKQREGLQKQTKIQQQNQKLLFASQNTLKLKGKSQLQINNLKINELKTGLKLQKQELENIKLSLEGAKKREGQYRKFFEFISQGAFNAALLLVNVLGGAFDKIFKTDTVGFLTDSITKLRESAINLFAPDLTSDLENDLTDLQLKVVETQDAIDALKFDNIDLQAEAIERATKKVSVLASGFKSVGNTLSQGITVGEIDSTPLASITAESLRLKSVVDSLNESFDALVKGSIVSGLQDLGAGIGEALASGASVLGAVGASILKTMGTFVSKFGDQLIAYAAASKLFAKLQLALKSGNPALTIGAAVGLAAAGLALKAIGSAISSSAGAGLGGAGGGGGAGAGGSSQGSSTVTTFQPRGDGGGRVVFEIAGTKLIGVLNNAQNANNRAGGSANLTLD